MTTLKIWIFYNMDNEIFGLEEKIDADISHQIQIQVFRASYDGAGE